MKNWGHHHFVLYGLILLSKFSTEKIWKALGEPNCTLLSWLILHWKILKLANWLSKTNLLALFTNFASGPQRLLSTSIRIVPSKEIWILETIGALLSCLILHWKIATLTKWWWKAGSITLFTNFASGPQWLLSTFVRTLQYIYGSCTIIVQIMRVKCAMSPLTQTYCTL